METLAQMGIDLFGSALPGLDDIARLSGRVNSSDATKSAFSEEVENHLSEGTKSPCACGVGLFILGRYSEAIAKLQEAGESVAKWLYLGFCYNALGQFDKAVESFDKAVKAGADDKKVKLEKAGVYRKAKDFEAAQKLLAECKSDDCADYYYQLGRLQEFEGLYTEAMKSFKAALDIDSDHDRAIFHLAYRCDMAGRENEAIDYYKQIASTSPVHVSALLNLSVLYEDAGLWDKAEICVETVLDSHPNHSRALMFWKDIQSSRTMFYDEEKEKRRDKRNQILETPISDFELSVRSRNCLKKMNIATLGDLLRITEAKLLSYKNFGETSLREIKAMLDAKNLRLGMALEDGNFAETIEDSPAPEADAGVLSKGVDELQLSVRARKCLEKLNMHTLGDVTRKTEAELLGCKNFGVTSLNEIKRALTQYGVGLRKLD